MARGIKVGTSPNVKCPKEDWEETDGAARAPQNDNLWIITKITVYKFRTYSLTMGGQAKPSTASTIITLPM
jgi:hypothetical protein